MGPFSVGDPVLIRRGERGGQSAVVLASQPAEVYEVKMQDGSLLFYSRCQLEGAKEVLALPGRDAPPGNDAGAG